MKPLKLPFHFLMAITMVVLLLSCRNQKNNPEVPAIPDPPPFNPDYFRSYESHYHAVKIKFDDSGFHLAENKVYKLPGRAMDLKKFPPGKFNVSYFSASGDLIEEISMVSPLEAIKEYGYPSFKSATVTLLDSTTFFLPLHSSNQTKKLKIQLNLITSFETMVPSDTTDVIGKNMQMVPDTSLMNGKNQN